MSDNVSPTSRFNQRLKMLGRELHKAGFSVAFFEDDVEPLTLGSTNNIEASSLWVELPIGMRCGEEEEDEEAEEEFEYTCEHCEEGCNEIRTVVEDCSATDDGYERDWCEACIDSDTAKCALSDQLFSTESCSYSELADGNIVLDYYLIADSDKVKLAVKPK